MRDITFLKTEEGFYAQYIYPELNVQTRAMDATRVWIGSPGVDKGASLDLDQVEELHRRLEEHLKEHGRTPKPAPVKKWRDG